MTEIYLEGVLLDVDDKVGKIALTRQIASFLSLGSIRSDNTNRISLPPTQRNLAACQQAAALSSMSTKTKENIAIRIVQEGITTVPAGVAQIVGVSSRIELDVQNGIKGFWDSLEGLYLNDIDLSTWNGQYETDRKDTSRNTTSGLVTPVVNYGQLVDGTTYVDGYTYESAVVPFFYYHSIMTQIFALTGFEKAGDIFADTNRYLKLAMSTRLVYNDVWAAAKFCRTFKDTISSANNGTGPYYDRASPFSFTTYKQGADNFFNNSNQRYEVTNADTALKFFRINVKLECQIAGWVTGGTFPGDPDDISNLQVQHYRGGVFLAGYQAVAAPDTNIASVEFQVDVMDDDDFTIAFNGALTGAGSTVLTNLVVTYSLVNTTDTDRVQGTDWFWYFNELLPRISLKDFIQDFMIMFAPLLVEENNVVTFKSWEEVLTSVTPSSTELLKRNTSKKPNIKYGPTGWARENKFLWQVQDDENIITADYGSGSIDIDNDLLVATRDAYTSIFTASDQITDVRINQAAQITIYDQAGPAFTKAASFGSRLLLLRADDGVNFRFKAGTSRTDYFIGYFIDKNQTYNLDWVELLTENYGTFEKVLNNYAEVIDEYLITQAQLLKMDLQNTFIKDGTMYWMEKVGPFTKGKFTQFKLIRLLIS